jgi:fucose permease
MTFLLYVAAEMGTGLWAASILVGERQFTAASAALWVSFYFGSITAGRFGIGLVANRMGNRRLIRLGILVALCGALVFALPTALSQFGLILMGLGCAPIYPSMMHETARRFPADRVTGVIARQIGFSYIGAAAVPAACGLLAAYAGLVAVMPVVLLLLLALWLSTEHLNRLT